MRDVGGNKGKQPRRGLDSQMGTDQASKQSSLHRKRRYISSWSTNDEDHDDDLNARPQKLGRPITPEAEPQTLACPFWKANPSKYMECLIRNKLTTTNYVRQHLLRSHHISFECPRCMASFRDNASFEQHIIHGNCKLVELHEGRDGLTEAQFTALRCLPRRSSESERWFSMWDIIFPNVPRPPSPYVHDACSEIGILLVGSYLEIRQFRATRAQHTMLNSSDIREIEEGVLSDLLDYIGSGSWKGSLKAGEPFRFAAHWDRSSQVYTRGPREKGSSRGESPLQSTGSDGRGRALETQPPMLSGGLMPTSSMAPSDGSVAGRDVATSYSHLATQNFPPFAFGPNQSPQTSISLPSISPIDHQQDASPYQFLWPPRQEAGTDNLHVISMGRGSDDTPFNEQGGGFSGRTTSPPPKEAPPQPPRPPSPETEAAEQAEEARSPPPPPRRTSRLSQPPPPSPSHISSSSGYTCKPCNQTFASRDLLAEHEKTYQYACPEEKPERCGKHFLSRKDLNRHATFVHGSNYSACPTPGCEYRQRPDNLRRHMRLKHGIVDAAMAPTARTTTTAEAQPQQEEVETPRLD